MDRHERRRCQITWESLEIMRKRIRTIELRRRVSLMSRKIIFFGCLRYVLCRWRYEWDDGWATTGNFTIGRKRSGKCSSNLHGSHQYSCVVEGVVCVDLYTVVSFSKMILCHYWRWKKDLILSDVLHFEVGDDDDKMITIWITWILGCVCLESVIR